MSPQVAARTGSRWRIAVVEDHLLQRRRTEDLLREQGSFEVVHSTDTMPEFMTWFECTGEAGRPHLVLLDLMADRGPDADPVAVRKLVTAGTRVLVISAMASSPLVRDMLRSGIGGIVSKRDSEADIISAVWSVLGGRSWVTPELAAVMASDEGRPSLSEQEARALVLYASGLTLEAVASELGVRPDTAKTYLGRVKAKYAEAGRPVRSKVDLNMAAVADGYLTPPDAPR